MFSFTLLSHFSPCTFAWEGGKILSQRPDVMRLMVTLQDYEEHGVNLCHKKFDI